MSWLGGLVGRRDFTLLWVGQAVSQLGSRTYGVAYMLWVLAVTGSAAAVGLAASCTLAAFAGTQLPAGWLVDRFDRRQVMVGTDAASAVAALSLAGAAAAEWFHLGHLLLACSVLGVSWAVRPAAEMASIPHVVPEEKLPDAMALVQARAYAAGLAGPLLAGVLYTLAPWAAFLLDGVSYLVAMCCTAAVRTPLRTSLPTEDAVAISKPLGAVRDGLRVFWRQRFVRATAGLAAVSAFAVNAVGLSVIVLLQEADAPPTSMGIVLGMGSAAGLAGALATPLMQRLLSARRLMAIGPAASAVAVSCLPVATGTVPIGLVYAAVFLLQPAWEAIVTTRWVTLIDDEFRGRVQAAAGLLMAIPMAATPVIAGTLLETAGPRTTCYLLAGVMAGAAVAMVRVREPVGFTLTAAAPVR